LVAQGSVGSIRDAFILKASFFVYKEPPLTPMSFAVYRLVSLLLSPESFIPPRVCSIRENKVPIKRCSPSALASRQSKQSTAFCAAGGDPRHPGSLPCSVSTFRHCPAENHPVGGRGQQSLRSAGPGLRGVTPSPALNHRL
jgi:hypothetical protein